MLEDFKLGFVAHGFKNIKILSLDNKNEEDSAISKKDITETEHRHITEDYPNIIVFINLKALYDKSSRLFSIKNNMLLIKKLVIIVGKEKIWVQKRVFDSQIMEWIFKEQIIELKTETPETLAPVQPAI